MPYIKKDDGRRKALRNGFPAKNAGELNYQIFYNVKHNLDLNSSEKRIHLEKVIKKYVEQFLRQKVNYQRYNDMTGCLIRCYREIKRRLGINYKVLLSIMNSYDEEIAKYEDTKIISNGDVE